MKHRIAVISDTHGLIRDEVREVLKTCEIIIHGGDINVVNGRFCPQSVRSFCPVVAGFNAGTYKVPACVL